MNISVSSVLSTLIQQFPNSWHVFLVPATYTINTTVSNATSFTPFYLNRGYEPVSPLESQFDLPDLMGTYIERVQSAREIAKLKILEAQEIYKERWDKTHRPIKYEVGDLVFIEYPNLHTTPLSQKLQPKFAGPYQITKVLSDLNCEVRPLNSKAGTKVMNIRKFKRYTPRPPDLDFTPSFHPSLIPTAVPHTTIEDLPDDTAPIDSITPNQAPQDIASSGYKTRFGRHITKINLALLFATGSIFLAHALAVYIPPTIRVTPGLDFRPVPDNVVIFSQTTPIFFTANLTILRTYMYDHSIMNKNCSGFTPTQDMIPLCLFSNDIIKNLNFLTERNNLLTHAFLDVDSHQHTPVQPTDFASPGFITKNTADQVNNHITRLLVGGDLDDQPRPDTQDTVVTRVRRQIVMAAAAIAGLVGYVSSSLFSSSSSDGRLMYNSLQSNAHIDHQNIIRITDDVQALRNDTFDGLRDSAIKFTQAMNYQRTKINTLYDSFKTGEVRSAMIQAQTIQELTRLADLVAYHDVITACQNKRLPLSLIDAGLLRDELEILSTHLNPLDQELVIPIKTISPYYQLPLVNCHLLSNNDTATIILHVPIQPLNRKIILHEVISIPFKHHDEICQYNMPSTYVLLTNNKPLAIESTHAHACQPDNGYCHFREYSGTSKILFCLTRLVRGATNDVIRDSCPFSCRPSMGSSDIHITELGYQNFALTNPPHNSSIECTFPDGRMTQEFVKPEHTVGSQIIHLPCSCRINIPSFSPVFNPLPCMKSNSLLPEVSLVIPTLWANLSYDQVTKIIMVKPALLPKTSYENMSSIFKLEWADDKVQNPAQITELPDLPASYHFFNHLKDESHVYQDFLAFLWQVAISFAVLYLWARHTPSVLPWVATTAAYTPVVKAASLLESAVPLSPPADCGTEQKIAHRILIALITPVLITLVFVICMFGCFYICTKQKLRQDFTRMDKDRQLRSAERHRRREREIQMQPLQDRNSAPNFRPPPPPLPGAQAYYPLPPSPPNTPVKISAPLPPLETRLYCTTIFRESYHNNTNPRHIFAYTNSPPPHTDCSSQHVSPVLAPSALTFHSAHISLHPTSLHLTNNIRLPYTTTKSADFSNTGYMPRYTHGGYTYPDPVPQSVLGRRIPSPSLLAPPAPSGTWVQEWNSRLNQLVPVLLPPPSSPPVYTLDDEEVLQPVPPPTNHTISPPVYDISDSSHLPLRQTRTSPLLGLYRAFHRASPPTVDITTPPFSPLGNLEFSDISSSSLSDSVLATSTSDSFSTDSSSNSSHSNSSNEITFLGYFARSTPTGNNTPNTSCPLPCLLPGDSECSAVLQSHAQPYGDEFQIPAQQTDAATPSLRLTFPQTLMPQYRPHRPTIVDFIQAKHSSYKNLIKLIPYDQPTVVRRVLGLLPQEFVLRLPGHTTPTFDQLIRDITQHLAQHGPHLSPQPRLSNPPRCPPLYP
ncbi:Transposon Ty3-G Gag-Pol polyprotein [Folsomia candida]|uniref:Transposon Ty3-G Gag-Pol polyprotein n=1 Tax=Folsomia candida TaxID=158441 RepID=A0A226D587_FOLCA|nr:Transposon Ty3-G Gag-Pol polyprotein [Folsomia candida]